MSSEIIIVVWSLSSKSGKLECCLALRGPGQREVLITAPVVQPLRRAQRVPLWTSVYNVTTEGALVIVVLHPDLNSGQ